MVASQYKSTKTKYSYDEFASNFHDHVIIINHIVAMVALGENYE